MPIAMGSHVSEAELMDIAANAPTMQGQDLASKVTTREPYRLEGEGDRQGLVVAIDLGMKTDILRNLTGRGFDVEVVPADTNAQTILEMSPPRCLRLQRTRRSGAFNRHNHIAAENPGQTATVWSLPRSSNTRACRGSIDVQASVWPSRGESSRPADG